ncbi:hypothetical protein CYMTET_45098 [Cymbomonas tetramitiformis]|uniref:TOG domain-containing protein n=1 Tax=Cymbomonas tetramitiformis TaxID=36881 RepID=A0AAE0BYW5_9CHLO|nr:hypothetical protein CYMTET_45098 [Cymbomonas tetramitiformis]
MDLDATAEHVLRAVPLVDKLHARLVCRRWRRLLQSPGPWLHSLETGDTYTRVAAIRILGGFSPEILRGNSSTLQSSCPSTAARIDAISNCLTDPHWQVRWQAATTLGAAFGPAAGVHRESLARLLYDANIWVRWCAVVTIGQLDDPALCKSHLRALSHAAQGTPPRVTHTSAHVRRLQSPEKESRHAALVALVATLGEMEGMHTGSRAPLHVMGAVSACLEDAAPEVRLLAASAASTLAEPVTPAHLRALGKLLGDPDTRVRAAAWTSLTHQARCHTYGDVILEIATRCLADPLAQCNDAQNAGLVLQAVAEGGPNAALRVATAAAPLLSHEVGAVKLAAVTTLTNLGLVAAPYASDLVVCLTDADSSVRQAAVQALQRLGGQARPHMGHLVRCLEDSDRTTRCLATQALLSLRQHACGVIPALGALLEHANADTRASAICALSGEGCLEHRCAPGRRVDAAALRLGHEEAATQEAALEALCGLREHSRSHIPDITALLESPWTSVRALAARALGHCGEALAAKAMGHCGGSGGDTGATSVALVGRLADESIVVRQAAVDALALYWGGSDMPGSVIKSVTCLSKAGDSGTRQAATEALGRLVPLHITDAKGETVEGGVRDSQHCRMALVLAARLEDGDARVRHTAVEALDRVTPMLSTEECTSLALAPALLKRLADDDGSVRQAATFALTRLGLSCAGPCADVLAERLDPVVEPDYQVRRAAVEVLGRLEAYAAPHAAPLARCLAAPEWGLRRSAQAALCRLADHAALTGLDVAVGLLASPSTDAREAASDALIDLKQYVAPEHMHAMEQLLKHSEAGARLAAATVLVKAGRLEAAVILLEHSSVQRRQEAVNALCACPSAAAAHTEEVAARLAHREPRVRGAAVAALHGLLPASLLAHGAGAWNVRDQAVAGVARCVTDVDEGVRAAAVSLLRLPALRTHVAAHVEIIARALDATDRLHGDHVAEVVAGLSGHAVENPVDLGPVAARLKSAFPAVRCAALNVFRAWILSAGPHSGTVSTQCVMAVAQGLEDEDVAVRGLAKDVLEGLQGAPCVARTLPYLEGLMAHSNSEVREAAVDMLGRIGARTAPSRLPVPVPEMVALLEDPDAMVRRAALVALAQLGDQDLACYSIEIVRRLEDGNPGVRLAAADTIARLGPEVAEEYADIVAMRLHDEDAGIRAVVLQVLLRLEEAKGNGWIVEHPEAIEGALGDLSAQVRRHALSALVLLGPEGVAAHLSAVVGSLCDGDAGVRRVAVHTLWKISAPGLPVVCDVIKLLDHNDVHVRDSAIQALAQLERNAPP